MKLPSLKAAYLIWVFLVVITMGYGLLTGAYQPMISFAVGKSVSLPYGMTPEQLQLGSVVVSLGITGVLIFASGLLVKRAAQNRKWAVWVLTVLGLWQVFVPVYSNITLNELQPGTVGAVEWLLGTLSSLTWLYILIAVHKLKSGQPGAPTPRFSAEGETNGGLRWVWGNLRQGVRGALFVPIARGRIHASWGQLVGLSALGIVLQFASDFIRTGPKGEFVSFGLPGILFGLPLVLLAAWAVTARAKRPEEALVLAVALSAIGLFVSAASPLVHRLLDKALERGSFFYAGEIDHYFDTVWFALAAGVASARLLASALLQRLSLFLLAGILIGGPLSQVFLDKTLWMKQYDREALEKEDALRHVLEREDVFYLQPALLERELASVKASGGNRINLYFVGMAGYSDQDVFMKEVNYVSQLFEKRYGAEAHSIELINNLDTVGDVPLASVTSLSRSLNRIGEVMNRERDILFLYLTSHGSRNHEFALDFGGMHFNVLNPFRLREILDASGIKRRVIVISACYSGGFIDALKDDNTLVITSAAPDRTSFGCSNEADFTYFGKAYFRDALPTTPSFIEAFNLAKPMIARWEGSDQDEHSNPQIYVGARIQGALDAFAKQEAARSDGGQAAPSGGVLVAGAGGGSVASLRQRALMGDDAAQLDLGVRYQMGRGVKQDYVQAVEWLQKSTAQGNANAMCNLAWAYLYGKGVAQDYSKARYLLQQAADKSVAYAQTTLGDMYEYGMGVPQDYAKALGYYRQAAMRGNAHAQIRIGDLYHLGSGVPQDDAKALEWYQKAAAQGTAEGYNELGYFLLERRERMAEAVGYLEKAMRMTPDSPAIMDSLGWGYYLTGKTAEGQQLLERAYALMRSPVIAAHLGEVQWAGGDHARARKVWGAALKVHPKDPTLSATVKKFMS